MYLTERHAALAAPAGLGGGGRLVEILIDLSKIFPAQCHIALGGVLLGQMDELQHRVSHRAVSH
jgi:hypothetical protein